MASKTFCDMWNLTNSVVPNAQSAPFSTELLVTIFWEETMFQNRPQPNWRGRGFGQVETTTLPDINRTFARKFTEASILGDEKQSVEVAFLNLKMLNQRLNSRQRVLEGYAGVWSKDARGKWVADSTKVAIVNAWNSCEKLLNSLGLVDNLKQSDLDERQITTIKKALKSAKANSNPDDAFSR
jgi:hypothetical protein